MSGRSRYQARPRPSTRPTMYDTLLAVLGVDDRHRAVIVDAAIPVQVEGGCDHCDAYQVAAPRYYGLDIVTHHDDDCPFLAEYEARSTRRPAPC